MVPKPKGKWRTIIDLERLNDFVTISKFRMESVQSVYTQLMAGNLTFSIDLTEAHLHVPIHQTTSHLHRGSV